MGLTSTFSIAKRGLQIAQTALDVVTHNISNVNTEGYSRQTLNLVTMYPENSRFGSLGTGVDATSITRMYDKYVNRNLVEKSSLLSKYEAQKTAMDSVESVFNESSGNGVNEALSEFWNAWQDVANNPEGTSERLNLLEKAETLASTINYMAADLDTIRTDINYRVAEEITEANALIQEIASLNEQIIALEGGSDTHQANDLRDRRQQTILDLSEIMDIHYYEDTTNGAVSVMTPKGTPLVMDVVYWQLDAKTDTGSGDINVVWRQGSSDKASTTESRGEVDITENIETGSIGGWLEAREQLLEFYEQFDEFTESLVQEINRQHSQGAGLNTYTELTSTYHISDNARYETDLTGDNNDLVFTALAEGATGDNIGIKIVKGGSLSVNTDYDALTEKYTITVTVPIDGSGQVAVSANEVADAINDTKSSITPTNPANYEAGDLIEATLTDYNNGENDMDVWLNEDDPNGYFWLNRQLDNLLEFGDEITYGYEYAQFETDFAGDNNDLVFIASDAGEDGEGISISFVDSGGATTTVTADAANNTIVIGLATDGTNYTTTASDIIDAINNDLTARSMVSAQLAEDSDGSGTVPLMSEKYTDRSGFFELVTYDTDGNAYVNKITVNPTDTREDVIDQINAIAGDFITANMETISGKNYITIKDKSGYGFAFGNDNSSALMALGINTFFSGYDTGTIQLNGILEEDIGLIATGMIDENGYVPTGDNTNALALADLKDQKFLISGQYATISEAYNSVSSNVGATTYTATSNYEFNSALVDQIQARRDMVSAVNLDEEMADLLKFQYMYQASAKMISVVDELLQTLLAIK